VTPPARNHPHMPTESNPAAPHSTDGAARWLTPLNLLLLAVPGAAAMKLAGASGAWMFAAAGLAIVPLAGVIGKATEALAARTGPGVGGLLNATFGNAAELVLALVILSRGPDLYPVVKATLTGSIIGNLLLVLGAAILAGGFRHREQTFNRDAAGIGTTLMALAAAGLLLPTLFFYLHHPAGPDDTRRVENLSEEIAVVLIGLYALSLFFALKTHSHLYRSDATAKDGEGGAHWSVRTALGAMLAATVAVAFLSEWLVGALEPATRALGMNGVFVGVIVVAVVGNAAEHFSAVQMAWRDRLDVSVRIAVSSSTQIALFVAPVLVFASLLLGHPAPLDLHFTPLEVVAVLLSVAVVALVSHDGESNWLEGAMLLALYLILALAFYNLPARAG
ncbi:MAG TPA: calcium/proton exchanger, partial [Gemmata sp.]